MIEPVNLKQTRAILIGALAFLCLLFVFLTLGTPYKTAAACKVSMPNDKGQLRHKIAVDEPGTYTLWLRVTAPKSTQDSVYAKIDNDCPMLIGDGGATQGFVWMNTAKGSIAAVAKFKLTAGEHTVTVAGHEAGAGVDRVMVTSNLFCTPTGDGSNCITPPNAEPAPPVQNAPQSPPGEVPSTTDGLNWWLVSVCALTIVAAFGFMIWKYISFTRSMMHPGANDGAIMAGGAFSPTTKLVTKLAHFFRHHRLIVFVCLLVIVAAAVVGIVFAASLGPGFEAESATLSGGAKIVKKAEASGGKYVVFEKNPAPSSPPSSSQGGGTTNQGSSPGSGSNQGGSSSSGGGSSGGQTGGGGSSSSQSCPAYPAFPDGNCTGVPAGVSLSNYTGPCTITANNTVIDGKTVNCSLEIQASNVQIKNSRINGTVLTPSGSLAYSFTITDSEVIAPQAAAWEQTGIGEANFTALRVEVTGGNRSVYCRKSCTVRDSWVHGQNIADSPRVHASGIRQSQGATIVHNRIHCSAEDTSSGGGCSADLTGYGDFEPVKDNRIEKNLFVATPGGACAYGGSSGDDGAKPYGDQASNIVFIDNMFQRGSSGNCGFYFPITDFDDTRPGNQWINNRWEDGAVLPPAN
jgi:uncharacterized membrane protein YgcG